MARVTLRKKKITKDRSSLYLDFYPPIPHPDKGTLTRREFLGIYLFDKPKSELDRRHNKETQKLAEHVRATRQLEIQNHDYGFLSDEKRNGNFVELFRGVAAQKMGSNSDNWNMALRYFMEFAGTYLRYADLNEVFCEDYKAYLLRGPAIGPRSQKIAVNTAVSYFGKFRNVLLKAYKSGFTNRNLYDLTPAIKDEETHREFLTIEEFQKLAATPVSNDLIKKAALFSGLTGLRFSDVQTLRWSEVRGEEGGYYIQFRQEKTAGAEVLPVSDLACSLLGVRGEGPEKVFKGLKYSALKVFFLKWLAKAGISKNITFHSFRHTYATLQLASGTDIFTVSKMLGHRHVKTTQIYTKVIDSKKREAANRIIIKLD
ncbi:site-specific integrase [Mucilaginibacter sp. X4EP1]|uniref:site-specific integrase n=1 Tax=Mucilaginibacter sp. X4EP1 TaxID=2723092 RepID=UPI002169BD8D|nr:site-specific integrase [Mucilaginibacter sp. X4EP1]MCS3814593.1 integrase [Mucilaginibacter sp. X4EP1]